MNKPPAKSQPVPAQIALEVRRPPPLKCRWQTATGEQAGCGKGMSPIVERWRTAQSRDYACCRCPLCGKAFAYYPAAGSVPPMVRGIDQR